MLCIGLIAALATSACGDSGPTSRPSSNATTSSGCIRVVEESGKKLAKCLQVAPDSKRVDLKVPPFSNPTSITNPVHPSGKLSQVIYGGQVDKLPFRTEFSLLPDIKTISWNGQQINAVTWQYLAYSDGRIQEIALDWFAQADDGSVSYLGEDVADYEDGVAISHAGSWLAGKDGPPAMIMPANPKVGDVYRVENMPEVVFEEVTVDSIGQTMPGPSGSVSGAIVVRELHMDATYSNKVFAPGYGEFSTGKGGDLEAASLAMPTDALAGPPPPQLVALSAAARRTYDAVGGNDWTRANAASKALKQAWAAYRAGGVPQLLDKQMSRDIDSFAKAVAARESAAAREAVLRVAQNDTDLRLRHEPVATIDKARLELWARQLIRDAASKEAGAVAGDVTTLKLIWDRVRHAVDQGTVTSVDGQLGKLRGAADKKDVASVGKAAPTLLATLSALQPR